MSLIPITELLRMQRANDWLEAVEGWQQSHGAERSYWRMRVQIEIDRERLTIEARRLELIRAAQPRKLAA